MSNKQNTTHKKKDSRSGPKAPKGSVKSRNGNTRVKPRSRRQNENFAPVARANTLVSHPGKNHSTKSGSQIESRSELLFTIPASTTAEFSVIKRIRANPLSYGTFKWLPSIAQNFESFRFKKFHIRYENRCSSATSGSVILSPNYDAADSSAQAASEALIYNNRATRDFSVWKNNTLILDPKALNRLYKSHTCMTDERFALTKQDLKTIDPAQIFICLDGVASGVTTGKVFIDYEIEFFDPHAPTEPINQGGAVINFGNSTVATSVPFTSLPLTVSNDLMQIMKPLSQLVAEGIVPSPTVTPTSIIGQLTKDYSGVLLSQLNGTGLAGYPGFYLSKSSSPAPVGTDGVLPGIQGPGITNATATSLKIAKKLIGEAGDFLKMDSPGAATIIGVYNQLAGTGAFF